MWDGARGRPGTSMLVPVVVAPVVAHAIWPTSDPLRHGLRLVLSLVIGVLVARHTALGPDVLRPLIGATVGAALIAVAFRATATSPAPAEPAPERPS